MNSKKISVMLTCYNLVEFIDKAIESVINQKMPCDWELLIGDDGSTDGTVDKIKLWVNQYPNNIKLFQWTNAECHTLSGSRAALNRAKLLERADGDYLIYLDGDDCWLGTTKLKRQYEVLEDPNNTDCVCCGHDIEWYDEDIQTARPVSSYSKKLCKFSPKEYWHNRMYLHTNTILFKSICKATMLEDDNCGFLNDTFITFCLLQYGDIIYIPQTWARYNISGKGLFTGASRAYQDVRNLLYSEKRHSVNAFLEHNDIVRSFVWRALMSYDGIHDVDKIAKLTKSLDKNVYKYTTLVSRKGTWDIIDKLCILELYVRHYYDRVIKKLKRLFN